MFWARTFSALALLTLFFLAFLLTNPVGLGLFILLGAALTFQVAREFSTIAKSIGLATLPIMTPVASMTLFLIALFRPNQVMTALAIFAIICWIRVLIAVRDPDIFRKTVASAAVMLLYVVPLIFLPVLYTRGYGDTYVGMKLALFLVLVTKAADIGAYLVGTACSKRRGGNHPIAPLISPKKSWEGAFGGLLFSIVIAFGVYFIFNFHGTMNATWAAILGAMLFFGGFFGDLCESAMKRTCGVKDSGHTIPGIGGALDLVDSLTINAPLFYIIITKVVN